jgi:hypothetical protein
MNFNKNNADIIVNNFEVAFGDELISRERLTTMLMEQIEYFIERRTEYFFNLMYRLDIDERKVRKALQPGENENPIRALADLIIDRQIQKNKTRAKYSDGGGEWAFDF